MVYGKKLAEAGVKYLGVSYSKMDCQAFVEQCLRDCGLEKNLAGSNAWYREVAAHGAVMTPEECVERLGFVPAGAFLFILEQDGKEPAKYRKDGLGNASHMGIVTGQGEGAIHSSASRGYVTESRFQNKTVRNGGWNRVGLWDQISFDYRDTGRTESGFFPTLRRGDRGEDVKELQELLQSFDYEIGSAGADGIFGRDTEAAVKAFQYDAMLNRDGIVGEETWGMLRWLAVKMKEVYYTVTIQHLTEEQANAVVETWGGTAKAEEEEGWDGWTG